MSGFRFFNARKLALSSVVFAATGLLSTAAMAQDGGAPAPEAKVADAPAPPAESSNPLSLSLFADTYFMHDWNNPSTPNANTAGSSANPGRASGFQPHRAYANANGFNLSFVGIDATYDAGEFAATTSLRLGPSVPVYYGGVQSPLGIENMLQAYITWKPSDSFSLDVGQFGTIFGAEVAESWQNVNYTRGALYYLMQPFYHTGAKGSVDLGGGLGFTGMVVNGVNEPKDGNNYQALAAQFSFEQDGFSAALGYLANTGPIGGFPGNSKPFAHFVDFLAGYETDDFRLVFNADYVVNSQETAPDDITNNSFYGLSLAARFALSEQFGVGLRGEFLNDPDNAAFGTPLMTANGPTPGPIDPVTGQEGPRPSADKMSLITGTLTLDYFPVPGKDNFLIRLDGRFEKADQKIYGTKSDKFKDTWITTTLGLVVRTP